MAIHGWDPEGVRCKSVNDDPLQAILGLVLFFGQSRFLDSKRAIGHYKLKESMTWPATPGTQNWVKFPDGPIYAQKPAFLEPNRSLSSVFCTFFDLRTRMSWPWPGPDLSKTGLKLILVVGGSLDVIESTSFSSPTAFSDPPRTPGDPPDPPQGGFG